MLQGRRVLDVGGQGRGKGKCRRMAVGASINYRSKVKAERSKRRLGRVWATDERVRMQTRTP